MPVNEYIVPDALSRRPDPMNRIFFKSLNIEDPEFPTKTRQSYESDELNTKLIHQFKNGGTHQYKKVAIYSYNYDYKDGFLYWKGYHELRNYVTT